MAVIADKCPHLNVVVVDVNKERIESWNDPDFSKLPIYELGLDKLLKGVEIKIFIFLQI